MTKHPSEFPSQSENTWVKVTEKSSCVIWRNGVGETVAFWETGDGEDSSWEIADSTNSASEEKSVGPFETYLDGLEYVNKFIPELGVEELPNKSYPDDKVVEIGSFPHKSGRDCHICEEDIYTCYRVEYGDESVKWFCPKCIAEKFNWDLEKEPTATIDFDSDEHHEGLTKARELLSNHSDALISAGITDVNTISMVLQSLNQHRYSSQREDVDKKEGGYQFQSDVINLMHEHRDKNPDLKWSSIRNSLNECRKFANEYAREEAGKRTGRRELIEEIEDSDLTPNQWFAKHTE